MRERSMEELERSGMAERDTEETGMGERDIEGLGWEMETPEFGGEQVRWCLEGMFEGYSGRTKSSQRC